ncbi:MAG: PadR family transcriptional regulator [Clostridiales bacterium]|nr:PadR family transcriptional regulator [Clostridiales bacterium]
MENIILSMLIFKAMTLYEIRAYIQRNLSSVCSDSMGSIQTAVKNLIKKGYIEVREYSENGKNKKQYSITVAGLDSYKEWIGTPINISKMTNMEEGKLFFLGVAPKEKRIAFLKDYISSLENEYEKFKAIKDFADQAREAVIEENASRVKKDKKTEKNLLSVAQEKDIKTVLENTYEYQMHILDYGISRTKADIGFYKVLLNKETAR